MFLKKTAVLLLPVAVLVAISLTCVRPVSVFSPGKPTVVLDAGHGGVDSGVVGVNTGVKESDLNLATVKRLKTFLEGAGINVVLTRSTEAGLYGAFTSGFKLRDLNERVRITNEVKADMFISVHMNRYSDKARRGAQVFFKIGDEKSVKLAECIQSELNDMAGGDRDYSVLGGDYYVLNGAKCPAILCECGFLSNAEDEKLLIDENYRSELCHTIMTGVVKYLAGENDGNGADRTI